MKKQTNALIPPISFGAAINNNSEQVTLRNRNSRIQPSMPSTDDRQFRVTAQAKCSTASSPFHKEQQFRRTADLAFPAKASIQQPSLADRSFLFSPSSISKDAQSQGKGLQKQDTISRAKAQAFTPDKSHWSMLQHNMNKFGGEKFLRQSIAQGSKASKRKRHHAKGSAVFEKTQMNKFSTIAPNISIDFEERPLLDRESTDQFFVPSQFKKKHIQVRLQTLQNKTGCGGFAQNAVGITDKDLFDLRNGLSSIKNSKLNQTLVTNKLSVVQAGDMKNLALQLKQPPSSRHPVIPSTTRDDKIGRGRAPSEIGGGSEKSYRNITASPPPFDMEDRQADSILNPNNMSRESILQKDSPAKRPKGAEDSKDSHAKQQSNANNQSASLLSSGTKFKKQDTIKIGDLTSSNKPGRGPKDFKQMSDTTKNLNSEESKAHIINVAVTKSSNSEVGSKIITDTNKAVASKMPSNLVSPSLPQSKSDLTESQTVRRKASGKKDESFGAGQSLNLIDGISKEVPGSKKHTQPSGIQKSSKVFPPSQDIAEVLDSPPSQKSGPPGSTHKKLKLGEKRLSPRSGEMCLTDNQGEESSQYILEPIKNWNNRNLLATVPDQMSMPKSPQNISLLDQQQMDQRKILEHLQNFQIIQERFKPAGVTPFHLALSEQTKTRLPNAWKFKTNFDPFIVKRKQTLSPVKDVSPSKPTTAAEQEGVQTSHRQGEPTVDLGILHNQKIDKIVITARSSPETNRLEDHSSVHGSQMQTHLESLALSRQSPEFTVHTLAKEKGGPTTFSKTSNQPSGPLQVMKSKSEIHNQFPSTQQHRASVKQVAKYHQAKRVRNQIVSSSLGKAEIRGAKPITIQKRIELLKQNLSGPLGQDKEYLEKFLKDPQLLDYGIQYKEGLIGTKKTPQHLVHYEALSEMLSNMKLAEAENKYKFFLSSSKNMLAQQRISPKMQKTRSKSLISKLNQTSARNIFAQGQDFNNQLNSYLNASGLKKSPATKKPTQIFKQLHQRRETSPIAKNDQQTSKISIPHYNQNNIQSPRYQHQGEGKGLEDGRNYLSHTSQDFLLSSNQNLRKSKLPPSGQPSIHAGIAPPGLEPPANSNMAHQQRENRSNMNDSRAKQRNGHIRAGTQVHAKINNSADLKQELNLTRANLTLFKNEHEQTRAEASHGMKKGNHISFALPDLKTTKQNSSNAPTVVAKDFITGQTRSKKVSVRQNPTLTEKSNKLVIITGGTPEQDEVEFGSIKDILKIESIRDLDKNFWQVATESYGNVMGACQTIQQTTANQAQAVSINFEKEAQSTERSLKSKYAPRCFRHLKKARLSTVSKEGKEYEKAAKDHLKHIFESTISPKFAQVINSVQQRQAASKQQSRAFNIETLAFDQLSTIARNSTQRSPRTAGGPMPSVFSPEAGVKRKFIKKGKRTSGTGKLEQVFRSTDIGQMRSKIIGIQSQAESAELSDELDAFHEVDSYFHRIQVDPNQDSTIQKSTGVDMGSALPTHRKSNDKTDEVPSVKTTTNDRSQHQGRNTIYTQVRGGTVEQLKQGHLKENSRYSDDQKINMNSGITNETEAGILRFGSKQSSWPNPAEALSEEQEGSSSVTKEIPHRMQTRNEYIKVNQQESKSPAGNRKVSPLQSHIKDSESPSQVNSNHTTDRHVPFQPSSAAKKRHTMVAVKGKTLEQEHLQIFNNHKEFVSSMQPKSKKEKRITRAGTRKIEARNPRILKIDTSKLQQYQADSLQNSSGRARPSETDREKRPFDYGLNKDEELQYESNVLIQQLSSRNSQQSNQKNYNRLGHSRRDKYNNKDLGSQFVEDPRQVEARGKLTDRAQRGKKTDRSPESKNTSEMTNKLFLDVNLKAGFRMPDQSLQATLNTRHAKANEPKDVQTHSRIKEHAQDYGSSSKDKFSRQSGTGLVNIEIPAGNLNRSEATEAKSRGDGDHPFSSGTIDANDQNQNLTFNQAAVRRSMDARSRPDIPHSERKKEVDDKLAPDFKMPGMTERTARFVSAARNSQLMAEQIYKTFGAQGPIAHRQLMNELKFLKEHIHHAYSNSPRHDNVLISNMDESLDSIDSHSKRIEHDFGMERDDGDSSTFNLKESSLQTALMKPKQRSPRPIKYTDQQHSKNASKQNSQITTTRLRDDFNRGTTTNQTSLLQAFLPTQIKAAIHRTRHDPNKNKNDTDLAGDSLNLESDIQAAATTSAELQKKAQLEEKVKLKYFSPKRNGLELIQNIEVMPAKVIPSSAEKTKRENTSPAQTMPSVLEGNSIHFVASPNAQDLQDLTNSLILTEPNLISTLTEQQQQRQQTAPKASPAFYGKQRLYEKNNLFIRQDPKAMNGRIDNISKQISISPQNQAFCKPQAPDNNQQRQTQASGLGSVIHSSTNQRAQKGIWGENHSISTQPAHSIHDQDDNDSKLKTSPFLNKEKTSQQLEYINSVFDQMILYQKSSGNTNSPPPIAIESRGPSQQTSLQQNQRESSIQQTLEKHTKQIQMQIKKEKLSQQHQVEHQFIDFQDLQVVGQSDELTKQIIKKHIQDQIRQEQKYIRQKFGSKRKSTLIVKHAQPQSPVEVTSEVRVSTKLNRNVIPLSGAIQETEDTKRFVDEGLGQVVGGLFVIEKEFAEGERKA